MVKDEHPHGTNHYQSIIYNHAASTSSSAALAQPDPLRNPSKLGRPTSRLSVFQHRVAAFTQHLEPMESRRSSRSPGLSGLPNEILSLILGWFCLHCRGGVTPQAFFPRPRQQRIRPSWSWYSRDCQSLHSACLVSTRLRDVAQPILYHQFSPGYGDSWLACRYQWTSRLLPFFCTVTGRPDLAAQVRHLHLNDHILESLGDSERAEVEPTLEQVSRARGIQLSGFLRPFQDWWQSSTGRNIAYRPGGLELAAMLLACLPNLACLSLSTPSPGLIPLSALRAANISSLRIQTLDFIYYGSSETVMGGIFEAASSNLRSLNLHTPDGADLRALARPLPNLRDLCITGSLLTGSNDLGFCLSHLRGIESFTYEAGESDYQPGPRHVWRYECRVGWKIVPHC